MMMCPDAYIDQHKDKTYKELLIERDELLGEIKNYEEEFEKYGEVDTDQDPGPDLIYQCNLLYLSKLLTLLQEKYNEEFEQDD